MNLFYIWNYNSKNFVDMEAVMTVSGNLQIQIPVSVEILHHYHPRRYHKKISNAIQSME